MCSLQHLDLAHNAALDGIDIAAGLKRNTSLTSLNLSGIPSANTDSSYDSIGTSLLNDENKCRLGLLTCDFFQASRMACHMLCDFFQAGLCVL